MVGRPAVTRASLRGVQRILVPVPMPLLPDRAWSHAEWQQIKLGYEAQDMDEKWSVFVEDSVAYLHRSWTGHGIFEASFCQTDNGWIISAALVESDPARYRHSSDEYDRTMLEAVLSRIVLGEAAAELRSQIVALTPRNTEDAAEVPAGALLHSALGLRTEPDDGRPAKQPTTRGELPE